MVLNTKKKQESIPLVTRDSMATSHGGTDSSADSSPERHAAGSADCRRPAHESPTDHHPLHRRAFTQILIFQSLISVAFLAVRENIVLYCTEVLFYREGGAPKMIEVYAALVPCLPVFGGLLADTCAGRYRMVKVGAFTTLAGLLLLTLDVIPLENWFARSISIEAKRGIFIIGFTLMFLGFASYGANVGPFAARQVEQAGEKAVRTLFHWFYWSASFGLAIALPIADYVDRVVNFGAGFGILSTLLIIGIVVLMCLGSDYVEVQPQRDALIRVLKIIWQGIRNRVSARYDDQESDSKQERPDGTLDYAKHEYGGSYRRLNVDEVKHLLKTLPAFHTVTIYAIVYYFIRSNYYEQFKRLNPYIGEVGESVHIPNVTFDLYSTGVVLLFTPILCYLYPWLEKRGFRVTPLRRIGVGVFFAATSVLSASLVEFHRKAVMDAGGSFPIPIGNVTYEAAPLSCFSLVPQYTFGGLGEAFVRVAGLEFAYLEGPEHLKGFSTGLYILMSGVGSYILARLLILLINAISSASPWYATEINDGHMQYFFLVLVGVLLFDLLYLGLISRKFEYAHWRERAAQEGAVPDVVPENDPVTSGYSRVADTSASDAEGSSTRGGGDSGS
ncbi:solute carrier family 15 member 4-like isoform X1 [Acanthaster planci]|uniref:Solute carrier family 15 member 4-like isoform X1 n=1 Tax=Acanthaster planci TaxID=133434 RepID=A0A8B7Z631_ACAPL|nr:solute carrier family 15 member 4-like isoform X1 [Acanthaster planci]XP_022100411.1 solute carrier family 15 member 4-like isoform X1 [Acanthaster planci]XP_022100412.1 solute carrier family 15 member 4-like isoform X1 [Acanthaster planci]